jgi:hypothetical protein
MDRRNQHLIAKGWLRAGPAGFDLASRRAAITACLVTVVALLAAHDDAVATGRGTPRGPRAIGLNLAVLRTPIEGHGVAVIAALSGFDYAVSTNSWCAYARAAGALETRLDFAGRGTAVTAHSIAVVALFRSRDDAISAQSRAGLSGDTTYIAGLDLTGRRATITTDGISVVALLVGCQYTVSAYGHVYARLARGWTTPVGFDLT